MAGKLTATKVENAKAGAKPYKLPDGPPISPRRQWPRRGLAANQRSAADGGQ